MIGSRDIAMPRVQLTVTESLLFDRCCVSCYMTYFKRWLRKHLRSNSDRCYHCCCSMSLQTKNMTLVIGLANQLDGFNLVYPSIPFLDPRLHAVSVRASQVWAWRISQHLQGLSVWWTVASWSSEGRKGWDSASWWGATQRRTPIVVAI